jgi:hypothetical protein
MKLNKYQNDTQIPLALFLQVLVLHLVHNFVFIRIFKDLSLRAFTKSQEYISNGKKLWATTLMNGANVLHKSATQISDLGSSNHISMCRDAALLRVVIHNCSLSSPSPPTIGGLWKAPESVLTPDAAAV